MKRTLQDIAKQVGGQLFGPPDLLITGISGIKEARPGDITFLSNARYAPLVYQTKASAILVSSGTQDISIPHISCDNPSAAFSKIAAQALKTAADNPLGVSTLACVSPTARIGTGVSIGPFAVIEDGAVIGNNTVLYAHTYVGQNVCIGADCRLYPHVTVREHVAIGSRVIIHSGAVLGSDGFGFILNNGTYEKIPQLGVVIIEDDVEIGANTTIDRARFDKTIIGKGTKIDNLVQIAHNVTIGNDCIIVAQAGVSGSTTIANNATLAGQAGIAGHLTIGKGAVIAAQAGVTKSVPDNTMVSGYPARPHGHARKVNACLQNLPELYKRIKVLEDALQQQKKHTAP